MGKLINRIKHLFKKESKPRVIIKPSPIITQCMVCKKSYKLHDDGRTDDAYCSDYCKRLYHWKACAVIKGWDTHKGGKIKVEKHGK